MSTIVASNLQAAGGAGTAAILASVNGGAIAGTRNRIINGGMLIDQRATPVQTFTAGAALEYDVDRWYGYCTGANVTGQLVPAPAVGKWRYEYTGAASVTAIGFGQRIERNNCIDLAGTTATLSVDLANSVLTTVTWSAFYANTADTFGTLASPTRTQIATGTFTVNSTVTRYSTQISVPAAATTGIEIVFTVGAQTSGTWTIGNVQLEAGSVATPFEHRSYGQELALCQRYYQVNNACSGVSYSTTNVSVGLSFFTPMRAAPTLSVVDTTSSLLQAGVGTRAVSGIASSDFLNANGCTTNLTCSTTGSGAVHCLRGGVVGISAEL